MVGAAQVFSFAPYIHLTIDNMFACFFSVILNLQVATIGGELVPVVQPAKVKVSTDDGHDDDDGGDCNDGDDGDL